MLNQQIGSRVKSIREREGLTQAALGEILGVEKATVSKYESGETKLSPDSLVKISELGQVTLDWLLLGKEPDKSRPPNIHISLSNGDKEAVQTAENVLKYANLDERFIVAEKTTQWQGPVLSEEEQELLDLFRLVDQGNKTIIMQVANNAALAFKQGAGRSRPSGGGSQELNCA